MSAKNINISQANQITYFPYPVILKLETPGKSFTTTSSTEQLVTNKVTNVRESIGILVIFEKIFMQAKKIINNSVFGQFYILLTAPVK